MAVEVYLLVASLENRGFTTKGTKDHEGMSLLRATVCPSE